MTQLPPDKRADLVAQVGEEFAHEIGRLIERLQVLAQKDTRGGREARRVLQKHRLPTTPPEETELDYQRAGYPSTRLSTKEQSKSEQSRAKARSRRRTR